MFEASVQTGCGSVQTRPHYWLRLIVSLNRKKHNLTVLQQACSRPTVDDTPLAADVMLDNLFQANLDIFVLAAVIQFYGNLKQSDWMR